MIPILLDVNMNPVGVLTDCSRCIITEERNGIYEAEFDYPMSSVLFNQINEGCWIRAKANDTTINKQNFKIYKISKPIFGVVTCYCEHQRYSINGIPVAAGTYSGNPALIIENMIKSVNISTDIEAWSDISTVKDIIKTVPSTMGQALAGTQNSVLDNFGGEFEFDNNKIKLYANRGTAKNIQIVYGKNLTEFTAESDTTSTYTSVYPYYYNEQGAKLVEIEGKTIKLANADNLPIKKCYILDLSSEFNSTPTSAQLKTRADKFISSNSLDTINYKFKINFVPLWQTEEYKYLAILERCSLCDTVQILHKPSQTNVRAKIIKTIYDVLNERFTSMELGNAISNFSSTISQTINNINNNVENSKSALQLQIEKSTKLITGNEGGYLLLNDTNADNKPDELLIMDTEDITTATNVWRFNKNGWGHSSTGYNGDFTLAATLDGGFVADFITTGVLNASLVKAGILSGIEIIATIGKIAGWTMNGTKLVSNSGTVELDSANNNIVINDTDGSKLMSLNYSGIDFWRNGKDIGHIGITAGRGADTWGLNFGLKNGGDAITWSLYDNDQGAYINRLRYEKDTGFTFVDPVIINADLKKANIVSGITTDGIVPVSGEFWAVKKMETDSEGKITSLTTGNVIVKNGLITSW